MNRLATWASVVGIGIVCMLCVQPRPAAQDAEFSNPHIVLLKERNDVGYITPDNAKLNPIRERLMKRRFLEEWQAFLSPLRLPKTLTLGTLQCNEANAFYQPVTRLIIYCYEYSLGIERTIDQLMKKSLPKGITVNRQQVLVGEVVATMIHELGHALFDILDVPVFGREEDGADQLAIFIALQFSPDVARTVIIADALYWLNVGDPGGQLPQRVTPGNEAVPCRLDPACAYAGEHGTGSQRMFNTLCIAYGGNPTVFKDLVDSGWLPKGRAPHCAEEYQQVRLAFQKTILPFLDPGMMKKVRARKWFQMGETEVAK